MHQEPQEETNLERRQELRHEEEAFRLHQEEKRLGTARRSNTFIGIVNSIFWLLGMLEILLVMRFFLHLPQYKFFAAHRTMRPYKKYGVAHPKDEFSIG